MFRFQNTKRYDSMHQNTVKIPFKISLYNESEQLGMQGGLEVSPALFWKSRKVPQFWKKRPWLKPSLGWICHSECSFKSIKEYCTESIFYLGPRCGSWCHITWIAFPNIVILKNKLTNETPRTAHIEHGKPKFDLLVL